MPDPAQVAASLSQLEGAMESYLALGSDTPLAGQVGSWLDDVRSEREASKVQEAEEATSPEPEAEDSSPSDFRGATKAARAAFGGQNGNSRGDDGGSKTAEAEQTPDDEAKKKRTKAY